MFLRLVSGVSRVTSRPCLNKICSAPSLFIWHWGRCHLSTPHNTSHCAINTGLSFLIQHFFIILTLGLKHPQCEEFCEAHRLNVDNFSKNPANPPTFCLARRSSCLAQHRVLEKYCVTKTILLTISIFAPSRHFSPSGRRYGHDSAQVRDSRRLWPVFIFMKYKIQSQS